MPMLSDVSDTWLQINICAERLVDRYLFRDISPRCVEKLAIVDRAALIGIPRSGKAAKMTAGKCGALAPNCAKLLIVRTAARPSWG